MVIAIFENSGGRRIFLKKRFEESQLREAQAHMLEVVVAIKKSVDPETYRIKYVENAKKRFQEAAKALSGNPEDVVLKVKFNVESEKYKAEAKRVAINKCAWEWKRILNW